MNIQGMQPESTSRARDTAVKAFQCYIKQENIEMSFVLKSIYQDQTGTTLAKVMDQFAAYLVFREKPLSRNTILSYFRNLKLWILDQFPLQRPAIEGKLLQMARIIDRYCMKRQDGDFVKKAVPCTAQHLEIIMSSLYANATGSLQYMDAALMCLLWHLFGRASDIEFLNKEHIALSQPNIVFVRIIRRKTSQEQGLSLFPCDNYKICPLTALAACLVMEERPATALFCHLRSNTTESAAFMAKKSLLEVLTSVEGEYPNLLQEERPKQQKASQGVHAYINRLLKRLSNLNESLSDLTSHSFRRGGVQHANGSADLALQWICDRGAWNMTGTNKAFSYIFNTPLEDQRVGKVLSGHGPKDVVCLLDMTIFDADTQVSIRKMQLQWFRNCSGHALGKFNVDNKVLDVLTMYLLKAYLNLKALNDGTPLIFTMEQGARMVGITPDMLSLWSSTLSIARYRDAALDENASASKKLESQSCLIDMLVQQNHNLMKQMQAFMSSLTNDTNNGNCSNATQRPEPSIKLLSRSTLISVWCQWYTMEPRVWETRDQATRHKRSEMKHVVAFMRLFIDLGYRLDERAQNYKDLVLATGEEASANMLHYLKNRGCNAKAPGTCLKEMRKILISGELDDRIFNLRCAYMSGEVLDPTPPKHIFCFGN